MYNSAHMPTKVATKPERDRVLRDMAATCEVILKDVTRLQVKLRAAAPKETVKAAAHLLRFHVDHIICNRDSDRMRMKHTTSGRRVLSLADLK